jgi:hypothetical protein
VKPLIDAAIQGNSQRVRQLLQQGVPPDTHDEHGETALNWAAHLGHTAVVKDMLAAGADREVVGNFLRATPLILAAQGGHRGIVALLAVFSDLNACDPYGATALMLAIQQKNGIIKPQRQILAILEILIHAGADLNLQDHSGNTTLMWATHWDNLPAVRLLLSGGADGKLKNHAPEKSTQPIRVLRRAYTHNLKAAKPAQILALAHQLIHLNDKLRWVAYELIHFHKPTLQSLDESDLEALGQGMDSWDKVDTFALYLSGVA